MFFRIQRAWRTLWSRKQGWQEVQKNRINHFETESQEDALPTNLPTGELGQSLTLVRKNLGERERERWRLSVGDLSCRLGLWDEDVELSVHWRNARICN